MRKLRITPLLVFTVLLGLRSFAAARTAASLGCNPNGNRFNLEMLTNAVFLGSDPFVTQGSESVALLPNRGNNQDDLVVGAALDSRDLNGGVTSTGNPNDAYYVQRGNTNCSADFEGGLPIISGFQPLDVEPVVAADPAHDAFFLAGIYFIAAPDTLGIGIVKSTATTLLNPTSCPNGTQTNSAACWPIGNIANALTQNALLLDPTIAVDQRRQGTGNGDVYVATTQSMGSQQQIILVACANFNLTCSTSVAVSDADKNPEFSTVQVRPDGGITVSYVNPLSDGTVELKFVTCQPNGAPRVPSCKAPVLIRREDRPANANPGEYPASAPLYPRHVHRLESDGTTTTFLVYDQCAVALLGFACPKAQVVVTHSTDSGQIWSTPEAVGTAAGQQFLGNLALDASTSTVNVVYYSSQNDQPFRIKTQVFLSQILAGQTTAGSAHQVTTALSYAPLGFFPFQPSIGVAAGGTGTPGESHVYIHFNGSTTKGIFNKQAFPIIHNLLTRFDY